MNALRRRLQPGLEPEPLVGPGPRPALRAATGWLLDLAFPARCAGCGREGAALCQACVPALVVRAGLPGGTPIGLPSETPAPLLQLEWCTPFSGPARRAIHALKYDGEQRLARPLGRAVARRWQAAGAGGDLLVPVPVHADRARERGFDHAQLIAEVAAAELDLPLAAILIRARATAAQFRLDQTERAANVRGAFAIDPGALRRRSVAGRWIVLVDDVVTTGATLAACAGELLAAGAAGVSAVTVARER